MRLCQYLGNRECTGNLHREVGQAQPSPCCCHVMPFHLTGLFSYLASGPIFQ